MLNTQVPRSHTKPNPLLPKPFISGSSSSSYGVRSIPVAGLSWKPKNAGVRYTAGKIRAAVAANPVEKAISVKAVVTVKLTVGGLFEDGVLSRGLDDISDLLGRTLSLELVSAELEPKTGAEKKPIQDFAHRISRNKNEAKYEATFTVPGSFGAIGGVLVENEHHREMFVKDIVLHGLLNGPVSVACESWVHSKYDNPEKRIFFTNKSYLPSQTPDGLKRLREKELAILRGDGQGERKKWERIYDYDTYNDLGDPDERADLARPVLGGKDHPYPRRCRTGRPPTKTDRLSESRRSDVYVPRDECFAEVKELTFTAKAAYSVLHALLPSLETYFVEPEREFPYFTAIDTLYNEGINVPDVKKKGFFDGLLPRLVRTVTEAGEQVLRFETPEMVDRDKFAWFRDEEFARQTLAGLNPYSIQLLTEWPLRSKLDENIYGSPESAITKDIIEKEINITVDEAIKNKKLFILDYHDAFLPFVNKVRELKGTTLYGSRTVFFLTPCGSLRPLAIELTRPRSEQKPQWKRAFTPSWEATGHWLWRHAKAHVLAHDSGYHQLISHWLRTHCCTEPYIIAANRHLSAMHPIYRLLLPYFRYTMEINGLARVKLINADGVIETSFSPGKYSIELSSALYDQQWRFDREALPADLIHRGLAVEDPTAPHGLKLTIEDYPFANDGLILWDIIKQWVTDYVNHYYPTPELVESDAEIQAWWTEVRTKGHADKKDEPWWPVLKTPADLVGILTTIIWVVSGHHAAVNFGQYHFGGYFPNRPTITRTPVPIEDPKDEDWKLFLRRPEVSLLQTFPSQLQATRVMAVLDVLSTHSPDEEYIGEQPEPAWVEDDYIKGAFEIFSGRLKELEGIIDERNADRNLSNRHGAGIVPYELLKPYSGHGVTGKGVPNSISI